LQLVNAKLTPSSGFWSGGHDAVIRVSWLVCFIALGDLDDDELCKEGLKKNSSGFEGERHFG
jgi:hypothetical protein